MIINITEYRLNPAFIVVLALLFASCSTTKNSYYFKTLQKDTTITGFITNDFESKIRAGDNLSIVATSLSNEEDLLFNKAAAVTVAGAGFPVREDGTVLLHRLGNVKAAGLTRKEFAAYLQTALLPYMKDPIVNVAYLNHKVTVLGSVAKPQVINMPEEQISLLDALVLSGDMTIEGRRNNVMVVRETGNEKKVKILNLEDHSIFTSPWYYVQPNDIVYVRPDYERTEKEEKRRNLRTNLSLLASGVSLIIIVMDRILR